jgi:hypothetical protein
MAPISYRLECTGQALETVKAHQDAPESDSTGEGLHFFGASECIYIGHFDDLDSHQALSVLLD